MSSRNRFFPVVSRAAGKTPGPTEPIGNSVGRRSAAPDVGDEHRADLSLDREDDAPRSDAAPKCSLMPASELLGIAAVGFTLHRGECVLDPLSITRRYPLEGSLGSAT